jgi:GxxExxY protein
MDTKTGKPKTDSPKSMPWNQSRCVLTQDVERLVRETIGCAIDVHRERGPGFLETVYHRSMCLALSARALRFATEYHVEVTYRGHRVGFQRLDLVVGDVVAVELKSVERLDFVHKAQLARSQLAGGSAVQFQCDAPDDPTSRSVRNKPPFSSC